MRKLAVSLVAYLVSGFVSMLVAQQIAVWSGAGQEFILVFFALTVAILVAGVCFFIAQFFGKRAIDRTGAVFVLLTIAALVPLWVLVERESVTEEARRKDFLLIAYLGIPILVMIAAHWLTVRLMQRP